MCTAMASPPQNQTTLNTTLVPGLLGFSPQMLLGNIIDAVVNANTLCMQATSGKITFLYSSIIALL